MADSEKEKKKGGSRRQLKKRAKPEALKERWMDNGEHSVQMTIACFVVNAWCSLCKNLTEGTLERVEHFVFVC